MAGLNSGDPAYLYGSDIRKGINDWRKQAARKLISFKIDSILPDVQSLPISLKYFTGDRGWLLRFSERIAADWMSIKRGSMPASGSLTQMDAQNTNNLAFQRFAAAYRI